MAASLEGPVVLVAAGVGVYEMIFPLESHSLDPLRSKPRLILQTYLYYLSQQPPTQTPILS